MTTVTLPDGKKISVSNLPEAWWNLDGATGYIDPHILIPDPNQPRKMIGGSDWPEFIESVRASGVRELIRVTPRSLAPWVKVPGDNQGQFVIVSGHRRHKAACAVQLAAVPILIKVYNSEVAYREDADELNTNRKDLTPLEEAIEIQRRHDAGDSLDQIAKKRGMSLITCSGRLKLLNLAPEIRELIDPTVRQGKRSDFPINVASALGTISNLTIPEFLQMVEKFELGKPDINQSDNEQKLDYAIQRMLLKYIEDHRMSAPQAIEFIKSGRRNAGHGRHQGGVATGRSASKTMLAVKHVLEGPTKAITTSLNRPTLRAACTDTSTEDLEKYIATGKKSVEELTRVIDLLQSIHDARPRKAAAAASLFTPTTVRKIEGSAAAEIAARYGATLKSS